MTTAIYPGTFDPITNGHIDIIHRAAKLFDHVIIAVAANPAKQPLFDLTERLSLIQPIFKNTNAISVLGFDTLLIDFAKKLSAHVILRGLRSMADFDFESQLAGMNYTLAPEIDTVFMLPAPEFRHIASSLVRECALLNGDISSLVPTGVVRALKEKSITK
jgi:pantetheine-phosphate adenylyltransferase